VREEKHLERLAVRGRDARRFLRKSKRNGRVLP
jgi:hypothetical protein